MTVRRFKCRICGNIYSPLEGEPQKGISPGTEFEDLPEDYTCSVCELEEKGKIGKNYFEEWNPTKYVCRNCDYVYDEEMGEPQRGIAPGTRFEDLPANPDDYCCPVCQIDEKTVKEIGKVSKDAFSPLVEEPEKPAESQGSAGSPPS